MTTGCAQVEKPSGRRAPRRRLRGSRAAELHASARSMVVENPCAAPQTPPSARSRQPGGSKKRPRASLALPPAEWQPAAARMRYSAARACTGGALCRTRCAVARAATPLARSPQRRPRPPQPRYAPAEHACCGAAEPAGVHSVGAEQTSALLANARTPRVYGEAYRADCKHTAAPHARCNDGVVAEAGRACK
jgi:hypothetical protein